MSTIKNERWRITAASHTGAREAASTPVSGSTGPCSVRGVLPAPSCPHGSTGRTGLGSMRTRWSATARSEGHDQTVECES